MPSSVSPLLTKIGDKMNVLCLDMSTKATGYALFVDEKLCNYGVIRDESKCVQTRFLTMHKMIEEQIELALVEWIIVEDVPISAKSNLKTGKDLCVLQGILLSLAFSHNVNVELLKPTEWREKIGILHSEYTCKKCGNIFEDVSGLKAVTCDKCGNNKLKEFNRSPQNLRNQLKGRAVDLANKEFDLDLYYKGQSKKNEDDIAEAICLYLSWKKMNERKLKNGEEDV